MMSEPVVFNVYSSPFTGNQMSVVDDFDPCQGGRRLTPQGKVSAEMQSSYWGRVRYRINVRLKISDANQGIHNYFADVKSRMIAEGRLTA